VLVAGGLFDVILSMVGGGNDGVTLRFVSAMHLGDGADGPKGKQEVSTT